MATFEQLSAEQRAIVELLLQRGKDYAAISDALSVPETRVRELARDALVELAPVTARGVDEDWRGQLTDYVLGQQSGPEATATRGHLRRSEPARAWTRSLLDSLEQLYDNGSMPAVPDGERARPRRTAAVAGGLPGADVTRRRRAAAIAGALVAAVLLAVLVWPVGVLTGGDDGDAPARANTAAQGDGNPAGLAILYGQKAQRVVQIQATGLPPSDQETVYQLWLYNSQGQVKSLGAQVANASGTFQAAGNLPKDFTNYRFIDLSREPIDKNKKHSGDSVLRGTMPQKLAKVGGNKVVRLGSVELSPPAS